MKRITIKKLQEYNHILSQKEKDMLHSIKKCHFLKTDQAARLHFGGAPNPAAALRAVTRSLAKLQGMGLVQPLKRRISGVRAGSTSYVWTLKMAGMELLRLGMENQPNKPRTRKQIYEPTFIFLKHTLAISELYTYLKTRTNLISAEFEPVCWRCYATLFGANVTIKPDLYAITTADGYEDHWFFEVDLDTEAPCRIMRKCESYGRYYLTGQEQKRTGIFPRVAWIVPDYKRKSSLERHIAEKLSEYADLFVVATSEELPELIQTGAFPTHRVKPSENKMVDNSLIRGIHHD